MAVVIFILAAFMALFGILGYMFGSASALLVLVMVVVGLLIIANAGGRIITLINVLYRFTLAGGIGVMSSGGDLAALRTKMNTIPPLIPSDASGAVLLLILIMIILLAILLGRHRRFRRPPSGVGLLLGLISGYLVGAYLLGQVVPVAVASLPLPFGLGPKGAAPAAAAAATSNFGSQLLQAIGAANMTSRALVVSILIAAIIFAALLINLRGRGGGGSRSRSRDGARDRE